MKRKLRCFRYSVPLLVVVVWIYTNSSEKTFLTLYGAKIYADRQHKVKKWITLCDSHLRGNHRTGNHLFMLAAMLHLAQVTNRTLIMPRDGWKLDRVFDLRVERYNKSIKEMCPCRTVTTPRYDYDKRFDQAKFIREIADTNGTILFCGLSQTYKHSKVVEKELRRLLKFTDKVSDTASNILKQSNNSKRHMNIGVHVRRGDFLLTENIGAGLTVADITYFKTSFKYFTDRHKRVKFFVETDDLTWCLNNIANISSKAEIRFSRGAQEVDLAILSMCDAVIVSTGSFGWWGAWLARRTTVYFDGWPKKGSPLGREFRKDNYFIPEWIPL